MIENSTFEKIGVAEINSGEEYHHCNFIHCDFTDLLSIKATFENCLFTDCNFSLAKFNRNFKDVKFIDCKMTGADFTDIGRFFGSLYFKGSKLDYVNFGSVKMRKSTFLDCKIEEADFEETDLTLSIFDNCDLSRSSFNGANLEKADFSTSFNFSINSTVTRLKKTIFSEQELRGLLSHLDIIIK